MVTKIIPHKTTRGGHVAYHTLAYPQNDDGITRLTINTHKFSVVVFSIKEH